MTALKPITLETADTWIRWQGGKCPVHPETIVRPWLKAIGEAKYEYPAGKLDWGKRLHEGSRLPGSILGYRIISEPGVGV